MHHKTYTGIILKRQPHRETDEVITFWSWEEGKTRLLVRGVRKSVSRLKGAVAPLSWLHLHVVPSEYLPIVYNAKIIRTYAFSRHNLRRLSLVFNLFEMVLRSTADKQPNHEIYLLLRETLDRLEQTKERAEDLLIHFRLRLFKSLGYQLHFKNCVRCRSDLPRTSPHFLSLQAGGLICADCSHFVTDVQSVAGEVVGCLLELGQPAPTAVKDGQGAVKKKANQILSDFFYFFTERQMNSQEFLREHLLSET